MQVSTKTPLHTTHFIAVIYFTTSALEDVQGWFCVDTGGEGQWGAKAS